MNKRVNSRSNKTSSSAFKIILIVSILLILISILLINKSFTAKIISAPEKLNQGDAITGSFNLELREGEFIPSDSKFSVIFDNQMKELTLKEFIELSGINLQEQYGNYYSASSEISGAGNGYGWQGKKADYPAVSFRLQPEIFMIQEDQQPQEVEGSVVYGQEFVYDGLANLVPGTVQTLGKQLSDDSVSIRKENGKTVVSTNYYEEAFGFGKEFLGQENIISLDISKLNLIAQNSGQQTLLAELSYNSIIISSQSQAIDVSISLSEMPVAELPPITVQGNQGSCGDLSSPNTIYTLTNNVNSSGTCLNVLANNVTLDCQGYIVNYSSITEGSAVAVNGFNKTTIKNCVIRQTNPNIGTIIQAIDLYSSHNSVVINNSINVYQAYGIFAYGTNNSIINNNISNTYGIAVWIAINSNKSTVSGNTIKTAGDNSAGLQIDNNIDIIVSNNNISTAGVSNSPGISFSTVSNSTISNNNINAASQNGITASILNNNTFMNNVIKAGKIDFSVSGGTANVIINMTFNSTSWSTKASLIYSGGIRIDSADAIADPIGLKNISKYLNITNTTAANVLLNISYDTSPVYENSLKMYKHNGTAWILANTTSSLNGVDKINKVVYVNLTSFSIFAPMENLTTILDPGGCGDPALNVTNGYYQATGSATASGSNCFTVGAHGITLDCKGYTFQCTGSCGTFSGIDNTVGWENVTVKNCKFVSFNYPINFRNIDEGATIINNSAWKALGIYPYYDIVGIGKNILISDNVASDTTASAIYMSGSNITTINNVIDSTDGGGGGIYSAGGNNTIKNNSITITTGSPGIEIEFGINSTVSQNTIIGGNHNIFIKSNYSIISGNKMRGSGSYGIRADSLKDLQITGNNITGGSDSLYVTAGSNYTISNNNITSAGANGIYGNPLTSSNIFGNTIKSSTSYSIWLRGSGSTNNLIANNTIVGGTDAVNLEGNGCTISGNNMSGSSSYTILASGLSNINITDNIIVGGSDVLFIGDSNFIIKNNTIRGGSAQGIYTGSNGLSNSQIIGNDISYNPTGIWLRGGSTNNIITNNSIYGSTTYGIYLISSSSNTIYNNYFSNTANAWSDSANKWNTSKTVGTNIIGKGYIGGNFWEDYTGGDNDGDWIGSAAYSIGGGGGGIDSSPLVYNAAPSANQPVLNSTWGNNSLSENITCYYPSSSDPDNDSVYLVSNWYKNDKPLIVLNMPFERTAGLTAMDYSGLNNNGTLNPSGLKWVKGRFGNALNFDGSNDYVQSSGGYSFGSGNWSFEAWVYPKSNSIELFNSAGAGAGCSGTDRFRLFFENGTLKVVLCRGATSMMDAYVSDVLYSQNSWNHVVFQRQGNNIVGYLNGVSKSVALLDTGAVPTISTFYIGHAGDQYFNGKVAEARVYNRTLTGAEIQNSFSRGLLGLAPNNSNDKLLDYWPLNETSGNLAKDYSGSNNNGTLNGYTGVSPEWASGKVGDGLNFDGVDDYVSLKDTGFPAQNNPLTISLWMYATSDKDAHLISYGTATNNQALRIVRNTGSCGGYDNIYITHFGGSYDWSVGCYLPDLNKWYHIVYTHNETTERVYVNGTLVNSRAISPAFQITLTGTAYLGTYDTVPSAAFNGTLDEVRIYNKSLTSQQISQLYNEGLNNLTSSTIVSQELSRSNKFKCQIIPTDMRDDGLTVQNEIVIVPLSLSFKDPTPANAAVTANLSILINISITNAADFSEFKWNWNSTNYTFYDNSLKLMFNFDNVSALGDNSTYAADFSSYSNNGTLVNGVAWNSSGKYGNALKFDGINDYINEDILANDIQTGSLTFEAWIKPAVTFSSGMATQNLFILNDGPANNAALLSFIPGNGNMSFGIYDGVSAWSYLTSSTNSWTGGQWYYVAGVFDSATSKSYVYVNGVHEKNMSSVTRGGATYSVTAKIGSSYDGTGQYFNGTVDEVRIWNRTLSADEIKQHYYSNLNKYDTDKWQFYSNQLIAEPLNNATYTYQGFAKDINGNENQTGQRSITIFGVPPSINFTNPTPVDGTITTNTSVQINISITDSSSGLSEFKFNWNTNYTLYDNSLKLMMNFDNVSALGENSTYAVDASSYSNSGTLVGGTAWTGAGKYGKALQFDGGNDYVNMGNVLNIGTSPATISAWFKTSSSNPSMGIVSKAMKDSPYSGYWLGLGSGGAPSAGKVWIVFSSLNGDKGIMSPSAYNDGNWHHAVGLRDGTNIKLYLDGNLISSSAFAQDNVDTAKPLQIGAIESASVFNGTIDEVRIWNRSFSADEVKQNYYSSLNKYDTDRWAFYTNQTIAEPLNNATYTYQGFAKDTSGNANQTEQRSITILGIVPSINFTNPTPVNATITTNLSAQINISITNASDLAEFKFNWNTNYTFYNNSLVLMMNLDNVSALGENSTYAVDASSYSNNGILINGVLWNSSGKYGKALQFDGINDYVKIPGSNFVFGANNFTVEAWINIPR